MSMNTQTFQINGFHCDACVKVSTMKIKKINDVHDVTITAEGKASVSAEREIALDEVEQALSGLGYTVVMV